MGKTIACIAAGPSLTRALVRKAAETFDGLVMVSDSFRLVQGKDALLSKVLHHVATDVRWWNEWAGDDFHSRVHHGDVKPFTGKGQPPTPWKNTPLGASFLRSNRTVKLHSGALGLMVAAQTIGKSSGRVVLISHDLSFTNAERIHFFGNHPKHPNWGTPNPSDSNLALYRRQMMLCKRFLNPLNIEVVCGTPSSLCDKNLMAGLPIPLITW